MKAVPQDSVAYFKGMNTELKTLEDTRFFDLLAHVMGLPSAHVDADRTGFPSTSLFNKPKASVIIAIDSVGAGMFAFITISSIHFNLCIFEYVFKRKL